MRCFFLLAALCALSLADHKEHKGMDRIYNSAPACKKMVETYGYNVPNCATTCFQESHDAAKKCVGLEMKDKMSDPKSKACQRSSRKPMKKWFGTSCKWHNAVNQCMEGKEVPDSFVFDEADGHSHNTGDDMHMFKHTTQKECWDQVRILNDQCNERARNECPNYKYCDGSTDAPADKENLVKWSNAVRHLKYVKHKKAEEYENAVEKCMKQAKAEETLRSFF